MKAWRVVWVMRRQPQHNGRPLICQMRVRPHGPLIHVSCSSVYEIFGSLFPDELLAWLVDQQVIWPDCCTRWLGQPFIIDPVTNAANVRRSSVHLSLSQTVSHADRVQGRMHRCFPQSAVSTGWIRSPRSTLSSKTRPKALDISSLEFYPPLRSSIYPPVAVHLFHNDCRRPKTKPSTANKLYICQQTDHLLLSTTIFCPCQQTSSVAVKQTAQLLPVPKPIQLKQTISPKTALTRPKNVSKEIINQLCILCWDLCIVYHSTVLCQQSNEIFFNKINFFFMKTYKFISCKLLNVFSSVVGCLMSACSVRLMWPSLWWSCCVFGAVALSFCWSVWAVLSLAIGAHGHVMQPNITLYLPTNFPKILLQKIQQ